MDFPAGTVFLQCAKDFDDVLTQGGKRLSFGLGSRRRFAPQSTISARTSCNSRDRTGFNLETMWMYISHWMSKEAPGGILMLRGRPAWVQWAPLHPTHPQFASGLASQQCWCVWPSAATAMHGGCDRSVSPSAAPARHGRSDRNAPVVAASVRGDAWCRAFRPAQDVINGGGRGL